MEELNLKELTRRIEGMIQQNDQLQGVYTPLIVLNGWDHSFKPIKGEIITICLNEGDEGTLEKYMIIPLELDVIIEVEECADSSFAHPYTFYQVFTQHGWKEVIL
jgi:hypothetical protein